MNKNDFYKQLMSEYSFDAEKIKENAKRGKFARQKISPLAIGLTAAVAVCTVACGTLAVTMLDSRNSVDLVGNSGIAAMSGQERIKNAIEQLKDENNSTERMDAMITFSRPLSPDAARALLTTYSERISVKMMYMSDDSRASGENAVQAVFDNGSGEIKGVVVNTTKDVMRQLQNDPLVFLVELVEQADYENENVVPIDPADVETVEPIAPDNIIVTVPDTQEAVEKPNDDINTDPVTGTEESEEKYPTTEQATEESAETTEAVTESAETQESTETEPPATNEAPVTEQTTAPSETTEVEAPENTQQPDVLPDGVSLPTEPESFFYETVNLGAETAYFLNNSVFYVKTGYDISLYSFDGTSESLLDSAACTDARVVWADENGGRIMVSAVGEEDRRNKLFLLDADLGSIIDLGSEDVVMDGVIAGVGYNADTRLLVINVKEYGTYYVCAARLGSDNIADYIGTLFESTAKTTLLASSNDNVYLAVSDADLIQIYSVAAVSGEQKFIKTFDNAPVISRNLAFTHAVFAPAETAVIGYTQVFDPLTGSFISTGEFAPEVSFGASRHSFTMNGKCYTVSGGVIVPTESLSAIGAVDYRRSMSSQYTATAKNGCVKIVSSVYTKVNRTAKLAFGEYSDTCSAELRAAMNGAIGVNNALALEQCRASGITVPDELIQTIGVYYSENAKAKIMERCAVSVLGALDHTNGGLMAISAGGTSLYISSQDSSTASGTLYIKAGTFGGITAYRTMDVSFVLENGTWKLDSVLG